MNRRVNRSDRDIANALRAAGTTPAFEGSVENLATRIDAAAAPLLASRREWARRPIMWWDYAAEWSRMLVPAGLTVAAASVMMLWIMRPVPSAAAASSRASAAIMAEMGRGAPGTDVVDRAVEDLVGQPSTPPASRRRR